MSDESYSFTTAKARLEEIVAQVRKKDTSLEKSLDLLEEGVRLANACTELIDHADWTVGGAGEEVAEAGDAPTEATADEGGASVASESAGQAAEGASEGEAPSYEAESAEAGPSIEAEAVSESDSGDQPEGDA